MRTEFTNLKQKQQQQQNTINVLHIVNLIDEFKKAFSIGNVVGRHFEVGQITDSEEYQVKDPNDENKVIKSCKFEDTEVTHIVDAINLRNMVCTHFEYTT